MFKKLAVVYLIVFVIGIVCVFITAVGHNSRVFDWIIITIISLTNALIFQKLHNMDLDIKNLKK